MFFKTTPLPHPAGLRNKICLFTGDEGVATTAQTMGVHAVGTTDVIAKVKLLKRISAKD